MMPSAVVMEPMLLPLDSVNARRIKPKELLINAMPQGWLLAVGMGNSVTKPAGVIRPILLPENSVNHRLPSGPARILTGALLGVGIAYSVTLPAGVILPT